MGRKVEVDTDVCMELYLRLGDVTKVVELLRSKKVVNPRTGQPFGYQTIYAALRRDPRWQEAEAKQRALSMAQFGKLRKELGIG